MNCIRATQGHRTAQQRAALHYKLDRLIFSFQDRQIHNKLICFPLFTSENKHLWLTVRPLSQGSQWCPVILLVFGHGFYSVLKMCQSGQFYKPLTWIGKHLHSCWCEQMLIIACYFRENMPMISQRKCIPTNSWRYSPVTGTCPELNTELFGRGQSTQHFP